MIKIMEKFVNSLRGIEYWVTVPLFVLMLVLMIIQVVFRYILEIPLSFSEELCRYLFVCCTFLGGAIATAERGHIEINFTELAIVRFIKNPAGQMKAGIFMNIVRDLATILCLSLVAYETYMLVADQFRMGQVSTAMLMPFWIVTGSMFLGLTLSILHSVALIILNLSGRGPMGYEFAEGEKTSCIS
ncbi:MAG: TRAP transporter small permease subunit [Smithellaceae bacterium]|nr:TRAP transporter small permease subunit [Smithellaceae bacterium]